MSKAAVSKYRRDIDGLRAVAILPVVFYHAGVAPFSGGFVGVDIFFVISGFLITQIITGEIDEGRFSIVNFYERRIRRIIPSLFTVLVTCTIIFSFVFLPQDLRAFARSLIATLGFASNILFSAEAGYFAAPSVTQPLLHTWSLAVEEQFYIFYPIFLILLARLWPGSRRYRPYVILAVLAVSFALNAYFIYRRPEQTFFWTPMRAWELMLGSVLAQIPNNIRINKHIREALAAIGLICVAWPIFAFSEDTLFPGFNAIYPCAGTALLIFANKDAPTFFGKILGLQPLVYLGLISYSLYLWHWPIIVLFRYVFLHPLTPLETIAAIALSVCLAAISLRFIEQPFRRKAGVFQRRALFATAFGGACLIFAAGFTIYRMDGNLGRFGPDVREMQTYLHYDVSGIYREGSCFLLPDQPASAYDRAACFTPQPGKNNILLWGDSHAAQYFYGLEQNLSGTDVHLLMAAASACPPVSGVDTSYRQNCKAFNDRIKNLLAEYKIRTVIISGAWSEYSDYREYVDTAVRYLTAHGTRVIVLGPSIVYYERLPNILSRYIAFGDIRAFRSSTFLNPQVLSADHFLLGRYGNRTDVRYISVFHSLCPNENCPPLVKQRIPMQIDPAHLTKEGSVYAGKILAPKIVAALTKAH
jgi:peptidoglycan/LPS O-acetylase OafA/YrhL